MAQATFAEDASAIAPEAELSEFVERRRTYRKRFTPRPVDSAARDRLVEAAGAEGAWLQRILLVACQHGLQASYLNQPIQAASLRAQASKSTERRFPADPSPQWLSSRRDYSDTTTAGRGGHRVGRSR